MSSPHTTLTTTGGQSQKSSPPAAPTREVSLLVSRIYSVMRTEQTDYRTFSISDKLAPTAEQREVLKIRGREIADGLKPADGNQARTVISALVNRLLVTYPQSERVSEQDARAAIAGYVDALADLPLWAVNAACQGWIRGEADGDNRFRPSAAELRTLAQRKLMPFRQEVEQIRRILTAQVYRDPTQEERDRVTARFQQILSETIGVPDDNPHAAPLYHPAPTVPAAVSTPSSTPPSISPALRERLANFAGAAA